MEYELLINELDSRGFRLTEMLALCSHEPHAEAIHQLRVSIRRYLAIIDVFGMLSGQRVSPKSTRSTLKKILDRYDHLRDLDVIIADLSAEPTIFNENSPFFFDLISKEQRLRESGNVAISDRQIKTTEILVKKTREHATKSLRKVTTNQIYRTLDKIFKRCLTISEMIDPEKPPTIHNLRIAFKKFRYSMEIFSDTLPDPPSDLFVRLRSFQTALGQVQDASVLIDMLDKFEREHPNNLRSDECLFATHRLQTRIETFMAALPELRYFWRAGKNRPTPWRSQPTNQDLLAFIEKLESRG